MYARYSDKLVELTPKSIRFSLYYFPFGAKHVQLSEIERIETLPPGLVTGSWRIWGSSDSRHWFPCDWHRPSRKVIYLLYRYGRRVRIGFTVEHDQQFQAVLAANGIRTQPSSAEKLLAQSKRTMSLQTGIVLLLVAAVCILTSLPLVAGWVAPNSTYGYRTPLTLSDPHIWYAANRFGGVAMIVAGALLGALGLLFVRRHNSRPTWAALLALLLGAALPVTAIVATLRYAASLG